MVTRSASLRLGAGLLVGAGAMAVTAVLIRNPAPEPILFVQPTVVDAPPDTPTTPPPASPSAPPPATAPRSVAPVETSLPVSPLAARLPPRQLAIPDLEPVVAPAELWIGDLALWAPIVPVGFQPDGQLEIPDETHVGWYRFGASPGRAGSTVLAAHVSWNDTIGPFFELGRLEPGAIIKLQLTDRTTRRYQVIERAQYGKRELPAERIWTRDGDETLVLITCGGDFNGQLRRYTDNIVIYAVPVIESSATP